MKTFEEVTEFIKKNRNMGWDDLIEKTGRSKCQVIMIWNTIHERDWKVFSCTKINDYIQLTNKNWKGRPVYSFVKEFKFRPSPNEIVIIPIGWEYDFMSIPAGFRWLIRPDADWGKLASILHDYRFLTKTKSFTKSNHEFYGHIRQQGCGIFKSIICFIALSIGGHLSWNSRNKQECILNLLNIKLRAYEYLEKTNGIEKEKIYLKKALGESSCSP